MDQMMQDYTAARQGSVSHGKMGSDYLFGFNTGDEFDTRYLESLIDDGYVPQDEMKELISVSLTVGHEQFDNALSRANTMRAKASFNNPLDAQDPLAFLSKVLEPSGPSDNDQKHQGVVVNPYIPHIQSNVNAEHIAKKRKRSKSRGRMNQDQRSKKRVKGEEDSPYWSVCSSHPSTPRSSRSARSKDRKKSHRSVKVEEAHSSPFTPPSPTVVRGIVNGYHSEDDESVSGSILLRNTTPLAPIDTEAGESSKESQQPATAPGDLHTMSDTVQINLDAREEGANSEKHETTSLETQTKRAPSHAPNQMPKHKTTSHYFDTITTPSPIKTKIIRPPRGTISCIPFPRLDAPQFGLIQEELASDPFRLLIAVTFLIRVKGKHAIPVFRELMNKYPTPNDLADADTNDIVTAIRHLGLATIRAAAIQKYARIWTTNPPHADVRYGVKNYPSLGDGADIRAGEALGPEDPRSGAWEIGHMTQGRYAIDSWRIFCRDVLLGRAQDWRGKGREGEFQPEWMRVLPQDKELRACLRWLWMQEGWAWDPRTGEKEVLPDNLRRAVDEGRVAYDDAGELKILDKEEEESD
ncbi:hypothetical protein Hte_005064 [Hypoxylon texense]